MILRTSRRGAPWSIVIVALLLFTAACSSEPVSLFHIHGLGYRADGKQLLVPAHYGIAVYEDGVWRKADGPEHDYMGFSVTQNAIYSSGHPAAGTGLPNPFGLLKSIDAGASWIWLGLDRWADFHVMAAGYHTNAVYAFSPTPNPVMKSPGLYATTDDGKSWRLAAANDAPEPAVLAVHPDRHDTVFVGGETGLYVSEDSGDHFRRVLPDLQVVAITAELAGDHVWISGLGAGPALMRVNWRTGEQQAIALPPLSKDMISHIALHPVTACEVTVATFGRNIFRTHDGGQRWQVLASDGAGVNAR